MPNKSNSIYFKHFLDFWKNVNEMVIGGGRCGVQTTLSSNLVCPSPFNNTQFLLCPIYYINTWALDPLSDCIDLPCQSSVSAAVTVAGWSDSSWRRCHVLLSTAVVRAWISLPPLRAPVLDRIFRAKCPTHVSVTRVYTQNTHGMYRGDDERENGRRIRNLCESRIRGENSVYVLSPECLGIQRE